MERITANHERLFWGLAQVSHPFFCTSRVFAYGFVASRPKVVEKFPQLLLSFLLLMQISRRKFFVFVVVVFCFGFGFGHPAGYLVDCLMMNQWLGG